MLAQQADKKPIRFTASKVDSSKSRDREKLFTKWMNQGDFKLELAIRQTNGEKLLYFECEGAKDEWRGIFVPRVDRETNYAFALPGEKEAALRIGQYIELGYTPTFIVPRKNFYCVILAKGPGFGSEPAALQGLGIGAPTIK